MSNIIFLNGKQVSDNLIERYNTQIQKIYDSNKCTYKRLPKLVVVTVGNDPASKVYVKNKRIACERCNIKFEHISFDTDVTMIKLKEVIQSLNNDDTIDGILVQQPLPPHLKGIDQYVNIQKDVDGFATYNIGSTLVPNKYSLIACTPQGIIHLLNNYSISLESKHVVILGRSNIVGKPLIGLLLNKNATVTSCNTFTSNITDITKTSDVLITAMGKPKIVKDTFIANKTQIIIDVGMNRDSEGKLCGDVDIDSITQYWNTLDDNVNRYITPVPGGVGPMTVASLIYNVLIAYTRNVAKPIDYMSGYGV